MAGESFDGTILGGILAGVAAAGGILYKLWQGIKQDTKGDNVDERIEKFTSTIQNQLDKTQAKFDALQATYTSVAAELAGTKVRAETLADENIRLRNELQQIHSIAKPKDVVPIT